MRLTEYGTPLVFPVVSRLTGETLMVDDRTFDPEIHYPEGEDAPKATDGDDTHAKHKKGAK